MSSVFVVDQNKTPLNPIHPGRARILLSSGRAAVLKRFPFTITLKRVVDEPDVTPLRLKLDPGSKTTGMAIVNDASGQVVFAAELTHRGQAIKAALVARRSIRHSRRQRKTRYRKARFSNRRRRAGWLPPSLESRIANVLTWVQRLRRLCPITDLSLELVKFDTQLLEYADIQGVEYQQGTRQGYEIREFLLEKWNRQCAYCGATEVPLQVEHIRSRAKGGSSRVSNLTLACGPCNAVKGTQNLEVFLADKTGVVPLFIKAMGRQRRQMCLMDRFGFPRTKGKQKPSKHTFRTGDIVKAAVPPHLKQAGVHVGRMTSKASGYFTIAKASGTVTDIGYRYCTRLQRADGYAYQQRRGCDFTPSS